MDTDDRIFKVVIIGNPYVGKTSLRRVYLGEGFPSNYLETLGSDFSFKSLTVDDHSFGLALWDLAGQQKFQSVHPLYYRGSMGSIVVYNVIDRDSFNDVSVWIHNFLTHSKHKDVPILLIGNKTDLIKEGNAYVTDEEHLELVRMIKEKYPENQIYSYRTSAKINQNVQKSFDDFGTQLLFWAREKAKESDRYNYLTGELDKNFPSAYLLTMNQISGPKIIGSSPSSTDAIIDLNKISNSAIKLIASLDFDDIISHGTVTGTFPWVEPLGTVYYIAFVIENENARGKKELYVLGFNADRELENAIAGLRGIVNGFLHGVLNEFNEIRSKTQIDFVTKAIQLEGHPDVVQLIEDMLYGLRLKVQKSLLRWYNIPE
ncbi:MAG: Rab family GTPase [Candidatus Kariarchaeaceae archaeon]|jgi:Ras-related protein Rab-1A